MMMIAFPAFADDWIVVPATQDPVMRYGTPSMFAWRIDRQTGGLEMCSYDFGGWLNSTTKKMMPESLKCTPANMPTQHLGDEQPQHRD
jgi:hypothetical protein